MPIKTNNKKPAKVGMPPIGTIISVPPLRSASDKPASVCIHHGARRSMCTIMEVETEPYWFLSCWGNGPGYVCFLEDWDGKSFYDVEITQVNLKSVSGIALEEEEEPNDA